MIIIIKWKSWTCYFNWTLWIFMFNNDLIRWIATVNKLTWLNCKRYCTFWKKNIATIYISCFSINKFTSSNEKITCKFSYKRCKKTLFYDLKKFYVMQKEIFVVIYINPNLWKCNLTVNWKNEVTNFYKNLLYLRTERV